MKIEVWSDFVCPFCYIGKRKLELALNEFPHKDKVEVVYKSFQLDPNSKKDTNKDMYTVLAEKYGMSIEQARGTINQVAAQAKEVGLHYNFEDMIPTNTLDAHRLAHFANKYGKMAELTEKILQAYFIEAKHIGDHQTLAGLAIEVGINKEEAISVLASNDYSEQVENDQEIARQVGVRGVPFFVFNQKYAVSGAQPNDVFLEVLEKAWNEETIEVKDGSNPGDDGCSDGSCSV